MNYDYVLGIVNSAVVTNNAALNRPAYQSSMHFTRNPYVPFPARYANDGSRHTRYNTGSRCAVTKKEANPWWAVDLGHPTAIYRVDLTSSVFSGRKTNFTGLDLLDL